MARRKSQPLFIDLIEIASLIPWWVCLFCALLSYVGFHYLAGIPVPTPTGLQDLSGSITYNAIKTFSCFLKFFVPTAFVIGGIVAIFKRKKRFKLLEAQTGIESIRTMKWQEFELLVGEAFRRLGYQVKELGGPGADGGIDLILYKDEKKYIVQCKRWKTYTVSVQPVRELFGVMHAQAADGCIFVSSGRYTKDALQFAHGKPIELVDGSQLVRLVRLVQSSGGSSIGIPEAEITPGARGCPVCGSAMVRRVAKKGINAGQTFWGCLKYPACKGTLSE